MVDFKKKLQAVSRSKETSPIAIYDTLDRASDKGPLREVQTDILQEWESARQGDKDLILKLHTGQGKTLIGLLILQSNINRTGEPALYLCPNNFLVDQTCEQARQFGLPVCTSSGELPPEFMNGEKILVTSVQKLFNGRTKFGLGGKSVPVNTILMDDAHACIDAIRDAFTIRIAHQQPGYEELISLFSDDLEKQGSGTYADVVNKVYDAVLPVPYWAWERASREVAGILSRHAGNDELKFSWPLIRDMLSYCHCTVSGARLEIAPYLPPLEMFGSYHNAQHRIFMSATITDDSFLVKGLRLPRKTIESPLRYDKERWSGEKMVLIPSLMHESLTREVVVENYAKVNEKAKSGVVALVPSTNGSRDWQAYGSTVSARDSIINDIAQLKAGAYATPLVVVNRYDGIDLPDDTCRTLIFDSMPFSDCLYDIYSECCRGESVTEVVRVARTIEQGLGRSVRGEKDYCVIIIVGSDLVRLIRTKSGREHLSIQLGAQVDIGLEIADMGKEEIEAGGNPLSVLQKLVRQCHSRDEGWKEFYRQQMDAVSGVANSNSALEAFEVELDAELRFQGGLIDAAVNRLQGYIDAKPISDAERGWHLQTMARYLHGSSAVKSNEMQKTAHKKSTALLKPHDGMEVKKITVVSQQRVANVMQWISQFETYEELKVTISGILDHLSFGTKAETFERSLNELSTAIGFDSQRPDRDWGEGPDNLWGLRDGEFLLFECKSEVLINRAEINKREAEQMNRSIAWFDKYYKGSRYANIMIIPTRVLSSSGSFLSEVKIMTDKRLSAFKASVRGFFAEFSAYDLANISETGVQKFLDTHGLSIDSIRDKYTEEVREKRRI